MRINNNHFESKVTVVTGAARGIGRNIAHHFAISGSTVWIIDLDNEAGTSTAQAMCDEGYDVHFLHTDLSIKGASEEAINTIAKASGTINFLVNNARAGERRGFNDEDEDNWDLATNVMLRSPFFCSRAALKHMAIAGNGSIVNISSVAGSVVSAESPSYHAAKSGLIHLTKYLAGVAGESKTRVNAVLPGFIVQDEHRKRYDRDDNRDYRKLVESVHPLEYEGHSDDVADAVMFLCSQQARFMTGQAITIDGGLTLQDQWALALKISN